MNCFASTYISGFNKIVEKAIKELYADCKIINNFDGLIVYETNKQLKDMPFVNNTYFVFDIKKCSGVNLNNDVKSLLSNKKYDFKKVVSFLRNKRTFKILAFDKNQPAQLNYSYVESIENSIKKDLSLKLGERKHDLDFVISRRSENYILFMLKITYNRLTEKDINKGTLKPELSYLMCKLADIQENDICMDMFCGQGSIPKQIVKHFKYNMVFASDNNEENILTLKKEFKNNNKKLYIKNRDALDLSYFDCDFIDKIITDPPWNIYNSNNESFVDFYVHSLIEMNRILKMSGKAVVLMGNIDEFEKALNIVKAFKVLDLYHILVNGKKANVYVLKKN